MSESTVDPIELPSLMDDDGFLAELEKLEGQPPAAAADRARRVALASGFATARQPMPSAGTRPVQERDQRESDVVEQPETADVEEPVIPRDANRWNLHSPAAVAEGPTVLASESASGTMMMAFLTILIGFSVGAVGSAVVFHERALQIITLFTR